MQEIRGCDRLTRIPNAPNFITGVTNLRGVIVPIVDLRVRFDLPDPSQDDKTVVIVLNLNDRVVGIVVDGVADVLSIDVDNICRPRTWPRCSLAATCLAGRARQSNDYSGEY